MTQVAIINKNTNICENVSTDPRPVSDIILPEPYFAIDLSITPAIDWVWNNTLQDWEQVEGIGNGGIGDVWDGTKLIQPKPANP